jgi:hypothetical protein
MLASLSRSRICKHRGQSLALPTLPSPCTRIPQHCPGLSIPAQTSRYPQTRRTLQTSDLQKTFPSSLSTTKTLSQLLESEMSSSLTPVVMTSFSATSSTLPNPRYTFCQWRQPANKVSSLADNAGQSITLQQGSFSCTAHRDLYSNLYTIQGMRQRISNSHFQFQAFHAQAQINVAPTAPEV